MRFALLAIVLAACDTGGDASPAADAGPADAAGPAGAFGSDAVLADALVPDAFAPDAFVGPLDDTLRLDHLQARGTHNSYHLRPDTLFHPSHDYAQVPLDEQIERQGVRQLELDLHARVEGGFDVLHLPLIDPNTTCLAFEDCLRTVERWSDAHPGHLPILIWIEPKDEGSAPVNGHVRSVDRMDQLDAAILEVLPRARLFTPDDLRRDHASVRDAVRADGWPNLAAVRGRIIFALLDRGDHRTSYIGEAADLADRLLFVNPDDTADPRAAFLKIDDGGSEEARAAVAAGFLVTSNVDAADGTPEENAAHRAAALANGVHWLSSDHPAPDGPDDADWLDIPGGNPARCNPVTAPEACTAAALEDL